MPSCDLAVSSAKPFSPRVLYGTVAVYHAQRAGSAVACDRTGDEITLDEVERIAI
jgi:hypothetical protein